MAVCGKVGFPVRVEVVLKRGAATKRALTVVAGWVAVDVCVPSVADVVPSVAKTVEQGGRCADTFRGRGDVRSCVGERWHSRTIPVDSQGAMRSCMETQLEHR